MTTTFDAEFWETHWQRTDAHGATLPVNQHLVTEVADLRPGLALDAGCGEGTEAIWLAEHDWQVTAADISPTALARAAQTASADPTASSRLEWVHADLSTWEPLRRFDLVATHYAHPAIAQLAFYERLAGWVAPGGTLLIVGHLHHDHHEHGHNEAGGEVGHHHHQQQPPPEASATADDIVAILDPAGWEIITTKEVSRHVATRPGETVAIHDVVVRARRLLNAVEH